MSYSIDNEERIKLSYEQRIIELENRIKELKTVLESKDKIIKFLTQTIEIQKELENNYGEV